MIQSIVAVPPGRARTRRVLLAVMVLLAAFYGGYELGRGSAGYAIIHAAADRLEARRRIRGLAGQVSDLTAANTALQRQVNTAAVERQVDEQAQADAQRMIGELQAETARQQQELQFYRGLVARQFGSGTLRVQELKIRPQDGRRYQVLVTLVQAAARDSIASGTLTIAVNGMRGGALLQLPLAELSAEGRRELPFSLRYFQQLTIPITLPEGFVPSGLLVEYRQGRVVEPVRQSFTWRVGEVADAGVDPAL